MMVALWATIHQINIQINTRLRVLIFEQLLADPIFKPQPIQMHRVNKDLPALSHIRIKSLWNRCCLRHLHPQIKTNRGGAAHINRSRGLMVIRCNSKGIPIEIRGPGIPPPSMVIGNGLSPPFTRCLFYHHSIDS